MKRSLIIGAAMLWLLPACVNPTISFSTSGTACHTQYFTPRQHESWTYTVSKKGTLPGTFVESVEGMTAHGFTTSDLAFGSWFTGAFSCTPAGISPLGLSLDPSVTVSGTRAQFLTRDLHGVTFPTTITPGDSWAQSFSLVGDPGSTEATVGAGEHVTIAFRAIGMTEVTVPTGAYHALAVSAVIKEYLSNGTGIAPITVLSNETFYLVEGTGMIKSERSISYPGAPTTSSTMELSAHLE